MRIWQDGQEFWQIVISCHILSNQIQFGQFSQVLAILDWLILSAAQDVWAAIWQALWDQVRWAFLSSTKFAQAATCAKTTYCRALSQCYAALLFHAVSFWRHHRPLLWETAFWSLRLALIKCACEANQFTNLRQVTQRALTAVSLEMGDWIFLKQSKRKSRVCNEISWGENNEIRPGRRVAVWSIWC